MSIMSTLPFGMPLTLQDLEGLPDDCCRYELVDGVLVVTPPPTQHHQELGNSLRDVLTAAAPSGWRCRTEYPLAFAVDTQRIPDLLVYGWPLTSPRRDARSPVGPADVGLLVEIVSPSTRRTDRFAKPGEYADAGIPLYWRLETDPELVLHAFRCREGVYVPEGVVTDAGLVPVPWGELEIDVRALGWG